MVLYLNETNDYFCTLNNSCPENYKLIKFSGSKKSFKDTMFGTDIGIHSHGFVNIAIIAMLLALSTLTLLYFSFRI